MYAELHAKTNFSFLEGASHPDELVRCAKELGYQALAITDRNSLAGMVRAHAAAKEVGLKLIVGAEITPEDGLPVVLWATDRTAYGRLARLVTCGRRRAPKGECRLTLDDVARHAEGLLAGVTARAPLDEPGERADLPARLEPYRAMFGDRCYLLAELHRGPDDRQQLEALADVARKARLPLAAAGDVHYHVPERRALHDVLTAIRCGSTVAAATAHLFPNAQRHLQPVEAIAAAFHAVPAAPIAARSRWTSCVTNIPRSWPRRAKRRLRTWRGSPGPGRENAIRAARPSGSASSWSTSCG
jgi:error-prone DNA polymerase